MPLRKNRRRGPSGIDPRAGPSRSKLSLARSFPSRADRHRCRPAPCAPSAFDRKPPGARVPALDRRVGRRGRDKPSSRPGSTRAPRPPPGGAAIRAIGSGPLARCHERIRPCVALEKDQGFASRGEDLGRMEPAPPRGTRPAFAPRTCLQRGRGRGPSRTRRVSSRPARTRSEATNGRVTFSRRPYPRLCPHVRDQVDPVAAEIVNGGRSRSPSAENRGSLGSRKSLRRAGSEADLSPGVRVPDRDSRRIGGDECLHGGRDEAVAAREIA